VRRPARASEFSANAVILLHQAECLMLHADHNVSRDGGLLMSTRAKLARARTSLKQAHTLLEQGRPHVWAWTWLRILEAQLEHERLLWSIAAGRPANERERMIVSALKSIRVGFDSCAVDAPAGTEEAFTGPRHRERELIILWWQLFCIHCAPYPPTDPDTLKGWQDLNEKADLGEFCQRQTKLEDAWIFILAQTGWTRQELLDVEKNLMIQPGMPLEYRAEPNTPQRQADAVQMPS